MHMSIKSHFEVDPPNLYLYLLLSSPYGPTMYCGTSTKHGEFSKQNQSIDTPKTKYICKPTYLSNLI